MGIKEWLDIIKTLEKMKIEYVPEDPRYKALEAAILELRRQVEFEWIGRRR